MPIHLEPQGWKAAVNAETLSDTARLSVCRELSAYWYRSGATHLDQALAGYEREVRARMADGRDGT